MFDFIIRINACQTTEQGANQIKGPDWNFSSNCNYKYIQTDFQYNHNGNKLAVSDSEGHIFIYERQNEGFIKTATFRGYTQNNAEIKHLSGN